MRDYDIGDIVNCYSSLLDNLKQFDREKSCWWVEAKELRRDIEHIDQIAKCNLVGNVSDLSDSESGTFWNKSVEDIIEEHNIQDPVYTNVRENVLATAHNVGVYDEIPCLKERIKERIKPAKIIGGVLLKAAIPFSLIYYGSQYIKDNELSKKEKREVYGRVIFGEIARFVGYSLIVLSCMYGNPSCNSEKDMDKKDNKPKTTIIEG